MSEFVAGKGTTALGIIGAVLGSIGAAGTLGNGVLGLGNQASSFEQTYACMHDVNKA